MASQKHLLRFALDNIPDEEGNWRIRKLSEELNRADEMLSRYFALHVVHVDFEDRRSEGYHEYCRDAVMQVGELVYVKPQITGSLRGNFSHPLLPVRWKYPFLKTKMSKVIRQDIGYDGAIMAVQLPEGGQIVEGDEFVLITDAYGKKGVSKISGLSGKPAYPLHSFTSIWHSHIDGDYGILDDAKVLYVARDLSAAVTPYAGPASSSLEKIAASTGYEIRQYRDRDKPVRSSGSTIVDIIGGLMGINFLTDSNGCLFTKSMHPEEQGYLGGRGIEVVEIPLAHTTPGGGLRCVYGEISVKSGPQPHSKL